MSLMTWKRYQIVMSIMSFMTWKWRLHSRMRNHHFQVSHWFWFRSKARIYFPQLIIWTRPYDSETAETEWPRTLTQCKPSGMSGKFFAKHVTLFYSSTENRTFICQFLTNIETNFIRRTLMPFFTKKGRLWIFLWGLWFFCDQKEKSAIPIFWYLSQDLTTIAQINYLLGCKTYTFQLFPHYKWEKMPYLLACLGQEPSSFFLSMMISWPEKRPASWKSH